MGPLKRRQSEVEERRGADATELDLTERVALDAAAIEERGGPRNNLIETSSFRSVSVPSESSTEVARILSSLSVATRSREIVQSERLISILRDTDSTLVANAEVILRHRVTGVSCQCTAIPFHG